MARMYVRQVWHLAMAAGMLALACVMWSPATAQTPPPVPPAPKPLGPAITQPVKLTWSAVPTATRYHVQVSVRGDFTTLAFNTDGVTTTSVELPLLPAGVPHFWHVRAVTPNGVTEWSPVWAFTPAPRPLAIPVQLAPVNNATEVSLLVKLRWSVVEGATAYVVHVASDATFTNLIAAISTQTSEIEVKNLFPSTKYYWRVRAYNSAVTSAYSTAWAFTTATPTTVPAVPVLRTPGNGSSNVPQPVVLSWNSVDGRERYGLQVATDEAFTHLVVNVDNLTTPSYKAETLAPYTRYFWRVRAINRVGSSAWSLVWRFTTIDNLPVPTVAPVLQTPVNNAVGIPLTVHLTWSAVENARWYRLQVSTGDTTATVLTYTVTGTEKDITLRAGTKYYWHVQALNGNGEGLWSAIWNFTIVTPSITLPAPMLSAPSSGATGVVRPVTLGWLPVEGAYAYSVQVATDELFTHLVFTEGTVLTNTITVSNLAANTRYFWRVKARTSTNVISPFSWVFRFDTAVE